MTKIQATNTVPEALGTDPTVKNQPTILVVDDQKSMVLVLSSIFKDGFTIKAFLNGLEAMKWLTQCTDSSTLPDVILLDLEVPHLHGKDFLVQLNYSGIYRDIPVVVVTGDNSDETKQFCLSHGAEAYITKPFDPKELRKKVLDVLNNKKLPLQN